MRRFFLSFLLAVSVVISLIFGLTALTNHQSGMMNDGCVLNDCTASHAENTGALTCISHCLQASTISDFVLTAVAGQSMLLLFVAFLAIIYFALQTAVQPFRSDNTIGKMLLHRQLSTVIIRD